MAEADKKTKNPWNSASSAVGLLFYLCWVMEELMHVVPNGSGWFTKIAAVLFAFGVLFWALEDRNRFRSIWFRLMMIMFPVGIWLWGFQLRAIGILTLLAYIYYKSFESFKGFFKTAAKSYRQIRDDLERRESESGKTDSLSG